MRYDKRTMTLRGYQLTLSCIGKGEKLILLNDGVRQLLYAGEPVHTEGVTSRLKVSRSSDEGRGSRERACFNKP